MSLRGTALLSLVVACGGRSMLDDGASSADDAGAKPDAASSAYRVAYTDQKELVDVWRSATGATSSIPASGWAREPTCTYDGRYIAIGVSKTGTFRVLDANGALVRSQVGVPGAFRPDGARLFVARPDPDLSGHFCVGTLDADETFTNVRCSDPMGETYGPAEYAPDGKTVLWWHNRYDPSTTATLSSLETALEDYSNPREIVPIPTDGKLLTSAGFSFDGSRVEYVACKVIYGDASCDLRIVRLDTLETTTVVSGPYIAAAAFTPDGSGLVYFQPSNQNPNPNVGLGPWSLMHLEVATGTVSTLLDDAHATRFSPPGLCVMRDPEH
jgi:hypothetical protein